MRMKSSLCSLLTLLILCQISHALHRLPLSNDDHIATNKAAKSSDLNFVRQYLGTNSSSNYELEHWTGKYFPERSTQTPPRRSAGNNPGKTERQKMMYAAINKDCDDGKTNLTVDWYDSPVNYTCYMEKFLPIDPKLPSIIHSETIPPLYEAEHACMSSHIYYDQMIPTFGTHRPAWPKYGEYRFVPVQRWLHNLEHGAVVMLYHPCANPILVNHVRHIVESCLYRHVITPYNLPIDRPFTLVTWGHYFAFNDPVTNQKGIVKFIQKHAKHAPEQMSRNGIYDHMLVKHAEVVKGSDINDTVLCPAFSHTSQHKVKSHKLDDSVVPPPRDKR